MRDARRSRLRSTTFWLTLLLATTPTLARGTGQAPEDAVGRWQGEADIIVTWCRQDKLAFDLTIEPDGTVSGTAGDATLVNGAFRKNNIVLIWLGNSRYFIQADLDGPIVAAEQIERDSLRVFADLEDGAIQGGFRTSGTKFGGRQSMVMTGRRLVLTRSEE